MWFVSTHAFNTHKLIVAVAPLTLICSKNQIPKWRGRGKVFNITGQPSRLLPLGALASRRTWRRLATKVGTTNNLPSDRLSDALCFTDCAFRLA